MLPTGQSPVRGTPGTSNVQGTSPPRQGAPVNIAKIQAESMNMPLIPKFINIKGEDPGTRILKGVFMGLTSPLLGPFIVGHAVVAGLRNVYIQSKVKERENLVEKRNAMIKERDEKLKSLQDEKKNAETFSAGLIMKRNLIFEDAQKKYPTPDDWNPGDTRTTQPKDPTNITAEDLKTPRDRFNYNNTTRRYQRWQNEANHAASNLSREIKTKNNDIAKIESKIAALNQSLGIKEQRPLPELPSKPAGFQESSTIHSTQREPRSLPATESPGVQLGRYAEELANLKPKLGETQGYELVMKGLTARHQLITQLKSEGKISDEDATKLIKENTQLARGASTSVGWPAALDVVLAGESGVPRQP